VERRVSEREIEREKQGDRRCAPRREQRGELETIQRSLYPVALLEKKREREDLAR
jgi:hypothetical protein